jgi:threonine/homoserine/homoserine lactone efflux protein
MIHHFWIFALTGLLLNLTPGNDMLYIASRSTGQGIKAGVISALGIAAGCLVHILAAVVGLSALITSSATAFTLIKYAGAAYLVYLGVKALCSGKGATFARLDKVPRQADRTIFMQGVLTNVLNPKVALFFLAFLPQFIEVDGGHLHQSILFLGVWFDVVGTLVNIGVAVLFGRLGNWLSRSPRWVQLQEKVTGLVLIALGIKVAFTIKK